MNNIVELAQGLGASGNELQTAFGNSGLQGNVDTSVQTAIVALFAVIGAVFLILTIYAGILWMTAAGNDEQVGKAKKIIVASAIGLVITMSSYALTSFIFKGVASPQPAAQENFQEYICECVINGTERTFSAPNDLAATNMCELSNDLCPGGGNVRKP